MERKPGGPQSRSENSREEKNLFCPYMKSNADDSVGQHCTDRGLPSAGHNCTAKITAEGSADSQGTGNTSQLPATASDVTWSVKSVTACRLAQGTNHI